jgi:hypothetical protein
MVWSCRARFFRAVFRRQLRVCVGAKMEFWREVASTRKCAAIAYLARCFCRCVSSSDCDDMIPAGNRATTQCGCLAHGITLKFRWKGTPPVRPTIAPIPVTICSHPRYHIVCSLRFSEPILTCADTGSANQLASRAGGREGRAG